MMLNLQTKAVALEHILDRDKARLSIVDCDVYDFTKMYSTNHQQEHIDNEAAAMEFAQLLGYRKFLPSQKLNENELLFRILNSNITGGSLTGAIELFDELHQKGVPYKIDDDGSYKRVHRIGVGLANQFGIPCSIFEKGNFGTPYMVYDRNAKFSIGTMELIQDKYEVKFSSELIRK